MGKHFIIIAGLISAFELTSKLSAGKIRNKAINEKDLPPEGKIYFFRNPIRFLQKRG